MEEGSRLAEDREKLSIEIGRIADIVREADYWSGAAKQKVTTGARTSRGPSRSTFSGRTDCATARSRGHRARRGARRHGRARRSGRSTDCRCSSSASFSFGRPSRITARVHVGTGPRHRHRARGEARRAAAFQGRHDPVGLSRRALRAGCAAVARGDARVRAILRRGRRRQRVVGRALRAASRRSPKRRSGKSSR